MSGRKNSKAAARTRRTPQGELPRFCDYHCPHATFAAPASVGACRREQAVYCTRYRAYNNKNSLCLARWQAE